MVAGKRGKASEKPAGRKIAPMPKKGKDFPPLPAMPGAEVLDMKPKVCMIHGDYNGAVCPGCGSIDGTVAERMKRVLPLKQGKQLHEVEPPKPEPGMDAGKAKKLLKGIGITLQPVQVLKINCTAKETLPLSAFDDFQHGFKTLPDANEAKLVREIKELGFLEPVSVWKHGKKNYIMNGHQRVAVLRKLHAAADLDVKDEIPVNYVEASDVQTAKRVCLALASNYGKTSRKGLTEFLTGSGISDQELQLSFNFPDLELEEFKRQMADVSFQADKEGKPEKMGQCWSCKMKGPLSKFKATLEEA